MDKAIEMGKVSAAGGFHLFMGRTMSTTIMAAGTIILTRLISPEEYGLYSIALMPPLMINLFRDWGVNSAMTKHIAYFRATSKDADTHDVFAAGLIFEIVTGLALTILSLLLASFIASTIFHRPETASLISIASITVFSGALLTAAQSSFVGFERMELNSLTVVCQSTVKSVAAPLLVLVGYGALGAVLGYTISFLAASIIGLATLHFVVLRKLRRNKTNRTEISKTLKRMLRYGAPLSVSTIIAGFQPQSYSFLMAFFVATQ